VNRQFTAALGAGLGARGDPFTDDLSPLLAIDGRSGVTRCRLARAREQRTEGGGLVALERGAHVEAYPKLARLSARLSCEGR
jgi:hypothetical protein